MEPMGIGVGNINQLKTKADVVKYAVEFTADVTTEGMLGNRKFTPNFEKAQAIIDFFNKNVALPETDTSVQDIVGMVKEFIGLAIKEAKGASTQES